MKKGRLAVLGAVVISALLVVSPLVTVGPDVELGHYVLNGKSYHVEEIVVGDGAKIQYSVASHHQTYGHHALDVVLFEAEDFFTWRGGKSAPFIRQGTSLETTSYSTSIDHAKRGTYYLVVLNSADTPAELTMRVNVHESYELIWWFASSVGIVCLFGMLLVNIKRKKNLKKGKPEKYYLNSGQSGEPKFLDLFKYPFNMKNTERVYRDLQFAEILLFGPLAGLLVINPLMDCPTYIVTAALLTGFFVYYCDIFSKLEKESMAEYHLFEHRASYFTYYYAPLGQILGLLVMSTGNTIVGIVIFALTSLAWLCVHFANRMPSLEKIKSYLNTMDLTNGNIMERSKQEEVARNLELVEDGLTRIGVEYPVNGGRIDILARDARGNHVVIELKREIANFKVIGQIERYIHHIRQSRPQSTVRGIIIANYFDSVVLDYCRRNPNLKCVSYGTITNAKTVKEGAKVVEEEMRKALESVIKEAKWRRGADVPDITGEYRITRNGGTFSFYIDEGLAQSDLMDAHLGLMDQFNNRTNFMLMTVINRIDGQGNDEVISMKL